MHNRSLILLTAGMLWSTSALASDTVWWLAETYEPTKQKIEGIRVKDIDPTWTKALPLSKKRLSKEGQRYLRSVPRLVHFSLDGDFNGDKVRDRALVGVYEKATGEKGKFFLILTRSSRSWKKAFLGEREGKAGFSYITQADDWLGWIECFECDAGDGIAWTKERGYSFVAPDIERPEEE